MDATAVMNAVRGKYTEVSVSAKGKFQYPTGREGATALGYDPALIESAPAGLLESFCGVGNPFSLGKLEPGNHVLDFGCGAGFDLYVASRLAGAQGRVYGVDLTPHMAERARANLTQAGATNFEIQSIASLTLPYGDRSFDVILSNGVLNLSPDKAVTLRELYRVLKPGGRFQFADVVLEQELPIALVNSAESWSQ